MRACAFLETWLTVLTKTAGASGRPLIFGRGDQPIPFVPVLDVAAMMSRATTDSTLRGQVLEIAGEPIPITDLARALQNARRRPGSPRPLPRPLLRTFSILARPLNPAFARQNQTALAMDTGLLTVGAPGDIPSSVHGLPLAGGVSHASMVIGTVLPMSTRGACSPTAAGSIRAKARA